MLSAWHRPDTVANIQLNTRADGWFHVGAYLTLALGVGLLWRATTVAGRRPHPDTFIAGLLLGGGGFNVLEGTLNHLLLGMHHVREGANSAIYDIVFLLGALAILSAGAVIWPRRR
jgi:uncharacterized membrane protein